MTNRGTRIEPFDPLTATEPELVALHQFTSALQRELLPDDPPTPLAVAMRTWRTPVSVMTTRVWLARRQDAVLGRAQLLFGNTDENRHAARFAIEVAAEERRQGLGRALLAPLAQAARSEARELLIADTNARIPGGAAFMARLGGARGLEATKRQLVVAERDLARIAEWRSGPAQLTDGFELLVRVGAWPESELESAVALYEIMNTAPRGAIAVSDQKVTVEQLRELERMLATRGSERWTFIARDRASGAWAGFTDLATSPAAPYLVSVLNTGVSPAYRGRGLARWLKAELLDWVAREHPEIRLVRTANADSNAAMVLINEQLGFKPYSAQTVWQAGLATLEGYLQATS